MVSQYSSNAGCHSPVDMGATLVAIGVPRFVRTSSLALSMWSAKQRSEQHLVGSVGIRHWW